VEMARQACNSLVTPTKQGHHTLLASHMLVLDRIPAPEFKSNGFGPFTVERKELRDQLIEMARTEGCGWEGTVHISGSKASGKTTLLLLVGEDLLNDGQTVYYFRNSKDLDSVLPEIEALDKELHKRIFFLVDETQENIGSSAFTFLLKTAKHILTIGAGVPDYRSASGHFRERLQTSVLFLKPEDLNKEGVIDYFVGGDSSIEQEVSVLVSHLCQHTGGHVYPLMRLSELLVAKIKFQSASAKECIAAYDSRGFRKSREFAEICDRILPDVENYDLLQLFHGDADQVATRRLQRAGFCDSSGRIISRLLVEAYLASLGTHVEIIHDLKQGLAGIEQVLRFGLSRMSWTQYNAHGGPVEDSLTFELLSKVARLGQMDLLLFNPKLVNAGTSGRRPDMFFNNVLNSYVEAVLSLVNNAQAASNLDNHISRFYESPDSDQPWYQLQNGQDFAVLHFQNCGEVPIQPSDKWKQVFDQRVFTYVMPTRQLFRGNLRVDHFPTAENSL